MLTGCGPVIYKALTKAKHTGRIYLMFIIYNMRHFGLSNKPQKWLSGKKNKTISQQLSTLSVPLIKSPASNVKSAVYWIYKL